MPHLSTEAISRSWSLAGLVLVGLLFFVWPIPHSTTLRDILLVAVLVLGLYSAYCMRQPVALPAAFRLPAALLALLTLWMVAVALLISGETAWSLAEIKGQWLRALVALTAGAVAAVAWGTSAMAKQRLVGAVGLALLVHVVVVDFSSIWTFLTKVLPAYSQHPPDDRIALRNSIGLPTRITGLTGGSDKSNYLSNMMLYLLLAEVFVRVAYRRAFLPIGHGLLVLCLAVTLLSINLEAMRNGVLEVAVVLVLLTGLFFHVVKKRIDARLSAVGLLSLLVLLIALGYSNFRATPGWRTLAETVPIALDTDTHRAWLSWESNKNALPRLKDGNEVDWSNYMRLARFKAGLEMAWERPLGVGFGRNAFAHAVRHKYNEHKSSHSHSGLVDLAIGVGIPGALLWIGFLLSLWWQALRRVVGSQSYPALLLLLVVSGFGFRMIVDSIIRDHMLQQFFFLVGLLAVLSARANAVARTGTHP